VYFFSNEPYLPTVGQSGTFKPVQAEVTEVDRIKLSAIASNLKIKLPYVQGLTTVSMFRDETFPNAATDDLFFTPSVQFAKANLDQMSAIQAVSTSIKAPESALSPFLGAGVAVLVGAGVTAFLMRRKS
jgi:hypothetical protein